MEKLEGLAYYAKKFERLRVDRSYGVAPHKPILLLSVMELIFKGAIAENRIVLSPILIATFLKYWSYLGTPRHNPDISRPFFHMRSGKFWHLYANSGFGRVIADKLRLKNYSAVKQAISHTYLDEDLFDSLQDNVTNTSLRSVLVSRWFSGRYEETTRILKSQEILDENEYLQQKYASFYHCSDLASTLRSMDRQLAWSNI
ncbi:MAG: hypothetical protein AB4040_02300 [Synechococcus sp.]